MSRKRQGGGKRRKALDHDEPFRMCVACRASRPREEMLRFVRDPGGALAFDVRGRLPGRGAWTCADPACVEKAVHKGGFQRAFEESLVAVDAAGLIALVCGILEGEARAGLGLLRKTGKLAAGRDDVARAVAEGGVVAVVVARDLSARTRSDVDKLGVAAVVPGPPMADIGHAIGRDKPTGVLAVLGGPRGGALVGDLHKLARLAKLEPPAPPHKPPPPPV